MTTPPQNVRWKRNHDTPRTGNICISMVENEQDIIEPLIRHNIRFFDLMFVLDNRSSNQTREILRHCAREFDGLCICDLPHQHYAQGNFVARWIQAPIRKGCLARRWQGFTRH